MIKIIRVGRERLREAYEIVNKVDQGMNVPEWFVAEPYEEFDFWMKKERGLLYLAVDEEGNPVGTIKEGDAVIFFNFRNAKFFCFGNAHFI